MLQSKTDLEYPFQKNAPVNLVKLLNLTIEKLYIFEFEISFESLFNLTENEL